MTRASGSSCRSASLLGPRRKKSKKRAAAGRDAAGRSPPPSRTGALSSAPLSLFLRLPVEHPPPTLKCRELHYSLGPPARARLCRATDTERRAGPAVSGQRSGGWSRCRRRRRRHGACADTPASAAAAASASAPRSDDVRARRGARSLAAGLCAAAAIASAAAATGPTGRARAMLLASAAPLGRRGVALLPPPCRRADSAASSGRATR
ncbi:uncharacterized protein LOC124613774 [Schistocerca americana]|uniref:uncharacterized protein LOC124613774 n=1 Tax=Schistocerca americana TaxID=7009 RepID=UPI001F502991|nr:uncharacterized protein LOC124613774 [Schistocerca americana]